MADSPAQILVVDDEVETTRLLCRWLESEGYICDAAHSGEDALQLLLGSRYDLIVSDLNMPGISGLELLAQLKARRSDAAVIMVTAETDRSTAIKALELGAYAYLTKPIDENELLINAVNALQRRRLELASLEYQGQLEQAVQSRTEEVRQVREEISLILVTASEFRDMETGAHVRRMGLYAEVMANALGWGRRAAAEMRLAAPMHDVGKIGVPDHILLKPDRLTDDEFEIIKQHPGIGAEILAGSDVPLIKTASDIAISHHERWDGSGYPHGHTGDVIPEPGRMVAIVDVYDALVHDRVYRKALSEEETIKVMAEGRGSHFDPRMFDVFLNKLPEIRGIREEVERLSERESSD